MGTSAGDWLTSEGQKLAGDGAPISAAGGIIIAGGALATATVVGAPEGIPTMAGGGTVAAIGGGVSLAGLGLQLLGAAYNFGTRGWSGLESVGIQLGATALDGTVGHFFPNLPDMLGPFNPIDAAAAKLSDGLGACH